LHVAGHVYFNTAQFHERVSFEYAVCEREAFFLGLWCRREVRFFGCQIRGSAHFHPAGKAGVSFEADVDFTGLTCGRDLIIEGVTFSGGADFSQIKVDGSVRFHPHGGSQTVIKGDATFSFARFGSGADFWEVAFRGATRFHGTSIEGGIQFDGVRCDQSLSFDLATIKGVTRLIRCQFKGHVSAIQAQIDTLCLHDLRLGALGTDRGEELARALAGLPVVARRKVSKALGRLGASVFEATVDLRGCRYSHVVGDCRSLLDRQEPYDEGAYRHAEETIRSDGDAATADAILYARLVRTQERRWKSPIRWPAASMWAMYWLCARYGVRPYYRLGACMLGLVIVGGFLFSQPGALQPVAEPSGGSLVHQAPWVVGFEMSAKQFLPIELPLAAGAYPSVKPISLPWVGEIALTYNEYATGERLAGWILIPLTIASLAGVLHRGRGSRG
jgi:hypothetical protein